MAERKISLSKEDFLKEVSDNHDKIDIIGQKVVRKLINAIKHHKAGNDTLVDTLLNELIEIYNEELKGDHQRPL